MRRVRWLRVVALLALVADAHARGDRRALDACERLLASYQRGLTMREWYAALDAESDAMLAEFCLVLLGVSFDGGAVVDSVARQARGQA